jgi:hypothetical protein
MMRIKYSLSGKKQIESILLISLIVASSIVILVSVTPPEVKAVDHTLGSAFAEDGNPAYDTDGIMNGIVVWNPNEDHIISADYVVEGMMTLVIPAMNYVNNRGAENEIWFNITGGGSKMDVYGVLTTDTDLTPFTKTAFMGPPLGGFWDGIYFWAGSQGMIQDSFFDSSLNGIVYNPGSQMLSPGISDTRFMNLAGYGVQMDGAIGYTNIDSMDSLDLLGASTHISVSNGALSITNSQFTSHGNDKNSLYISNADVVADELYFNGGNQPGDMVYIEGDSNGTSFSDCDFTGGLAGYNYVRVNGSSVSMDNCSFDTSSGQLSVIATENVAGTPAHAVLLNPTGDGNPGFFDDTFDNSTLTAIGSSSITLEWYLNVYVNDPDGNLISNSPVTVSAPSTPSSKQTDITGWARWFMLTEFVLYDGSITHYNPFNVSAENFSVLGYLDPELDLTMSMEVTVTVPFSQIPNTPPSVSWIPDPIGIQTGDIIIEYMLSDPNPEDDGNLSIEVYYSLDGDKWWAATQGAGGDPLVSLLNNTLYYYSWDSRADIGDVYNTTVYIQIVPSDGGGPGTPDNNGPFTVDNQPPLFLSLPSVSSTDTTATIEWMVDEDAYAGAWYGLDGVLTDETTNVSSSTAQSVTLTGLMPGRNYSYAINSTDLLGNGISSYPVTYYFHTKVYIQLYEGWNMISIPPIYKTTDLITILSSISGDYDSAQWYDANDGNDHWKHYKVGKPFGNDLTETYLNRGLLIHMKNDAVLMPDLDMPDSGSSNIVGMMPGWNFVGYPSVTSTPIDDALLGVPYDMVQTYDALTGQWLTYDGSSGSLTHMEMGRGYWIHCTGLVFWSVDYI